MAADRLNLCSFPGNNNSGRTETKSQPKRSDTFQTNIIGNVLLHPLPNVLKEYIDMNVKQISASVFLPLFLAVAPLTTDAVGVDGASAGANTIYGTAWDVLESVTVSPGAGYNQYCMVVCSADAGNPYVLGSSSDYRIAVTSGGIVLGGSDRRFEFEANAAIGDINWINVSTTAAFSLSTAVETISCSVRKVDLNDPNMTITDSSMSIVCADFELDNNPALPQVP
jgi:hypothetical protein